MGLEEGLASLAGAGLLGFGFWLARIPLKTLCDVWIEKVRGKENRRLEEERRKTCQRRPKTDPLATGEN